MAQRSTRRRFLQQSLVLGAGLGLSAASYARAAGANSRLRVASIGTGGKGWSDLTGVAASPMVDVVALCDIDEGPNFLGRAAEKFPSAQRYTDYRRLLDDAKAYDAVIVSRPITCMRRLPCRPCSSASTSIAKSRSRTPCSRLGRCSWPPSEPGVTTQMGNQIQSHTAYRTAVKLVHDGAIGRVRDVHSWQSGVMRWMFRERSARGL